MLKPIADMQERLKLARGDSTASYFQDLLIYGELLVKLSTVGLLAGVAEGRERHRYRIEHKLARSDGLGDWPSAMHDAAAGAASPHLIPEARIEGRELTQRLPADSASWQARAAVSLGHACRTIDRGFEPTPKKVTALGFVNDFVWLRNRTRAHGAARPGKLATATESLHGALEAFSQGFYLFQRPWAYLERQLSGDYRIVPLSAGGEAMLEESEAVEGTLADGLYVSMDGPRELHLVATDSDLTDFYLANGAARRASYDMLSYRTDDIVQGDLSVFATPPTPLPESETEGQASLVVQGESYGNLPSAGHNYVLREELEDELSRTLRSQRYPVLTLVGRGGIGKTSLALHVCHELARDGAFDAFLWFSARDIDLRPEGPKPVRPAVLSKRDIIDKYVELLEKDIAAGAAEEALQRGLGGDEGALLFVFDNFETVDTPLDLFQWIDTYVRPPCKVLFTTRFREFKGDYPLRVEGMTRPQFRRLVEGTAKRLGIEALVSSEYADEVFRESQGHPYVVKMLLGELARSGRRSRPQRVVADQEHVLEALFERTFSSLTPLERRLFLTLGSWRSAIPRLALEVALLRSVEERVDITVALDRLLEASLIELHSASDGEEFHTVPLAAAEFARRKLIADPIRTAVETDLESVRRFGAAQESDVAHGLTPRVEAFIRSVRHSIEQHKAAIATFRGTLDFIALRYPQAWLPISELYEEYTVEGPRMLPARTAIRRYLEHFPDDPHAWRRLAVLSGQADDAPAEAHALVEVAIRSRVYQDASFAAQRINALLRAGRLQLDREERRPLVGRLVKRLEDDLHEADATDCSRIAWLHLNLGEPSAARSIVDSGLRKDPRNQHCLGLRDRLDRGSDAKADYRRARRSE